MLSNSKPTFRSSFIQYWYCQNWSQLRWEQEFIMLRDIGITEIILASIADTKGKVAVFFTQIPGFTHGGTDMLEAALKAANRIGMKVRIGLGFSEDWWTKCYYKSWLDQEASINKAIIDEISSKFGSHPSFSGWYIPYEFSQASAPTRRHQANLNCFYKSMASEIKCTLPKDIMIAPFYSGRFRWVFFLCCWSAMLKNILKDTGIDTVALQDSIGAKFNNLEQLPSILSCTKEAIVALGIKFCVDVETFTQTSTGFESAPQRRIEKQL